MGVMQRHFRILMWKNFLLLRKKRVMVVFMTLVPACFSLILMYVRTQIEIKVKLTPHSWPPINPSSVCRKIRPLLYMKNGKKTVKAYYTPDTEITKKIMNLTEKFFENVGFANEEVMMTKMENECPDSDNCNVMIAVSFTNLPAGGKTLPTNIKYTIRDSSTERADMHDTTSLFPQRPTATPRVFRRKNYFDSCFLHQQHQINMAVIKVLRPNVDTSRVSVLLRRFPHPPYVLDKWRGVSARILSIALFVTFLLYVISIAKDVTEDKETKMRETLKLMGVSSVVQWMAWFAEYVIIMMVVLFFITVFLSIPVPLQKVTYDLNNSSGNAMGALDPTVQLSINGSSKSFTRSAIGKTEPTVLLLFLFAYMMAVIAFSFTVSSCFNGASSAAAAAAIVSCFLNAPSGVLLARFKTTSLAFKLAASLSFNLAKAFGFHIMATFEGTGTGIKWRTINVAPTADGNFTMLHCIVMLLLDAVLYILVAWYVDTVWPGEYGIGRPFYFPLQVSYWFSSPVSIGAEAVSANICQQGSKFEIDPVDVMAGVEIMNLKKVFGRGREHFVAVQDLSLNMYEGQITVLLGNNGAGKTTTMYMLTGFYPPTSGTAVLNGVDIRKDMERVRQSLGLCPQHNVLYNTLTVKEHLVFFAKLKNYPVSEIERDVGSLLEDIQLTDKSHVQSKALSGGMKRKLSVLLALIGGSKVVIMDEPTSGLDPEARRQTWDLLKKYRSGRTIMLTTHHMEEADYLGDRVAIMANGKLQCCGTPMYLKKKYGTGYRLVISRLAGCVVGEVTRLLQRHVSSARLEKCVGAELTYVLPTDSSQLFPSVFTSIDVNREQLRVIDYGLMATTMNEVFLTASDSAEEDQQASFVSVVKESPTVMFTGRDARNGCISLSLCQFWAMCMKRFKYLYRKPFVPIMQALMPSFFTWFIMAMVELKLYQSHPPLHLSLSLFGETIVVYGVAHSPTTKALALGEMYRQQFDGGSQEVVCLNNLSGYTASDSVHEYLLQKGKHDRHDYSYQLFVAAEFHSGPTGDVSVVAFYNYEAFHTTAISLNLVDNALLKHYVGSDYSIETTNYPRQVEGLPSEAGKISVFTKGILIAMGVVIALPVAIASFTLYAVSERVIGAKNAHFISGLHVPIYWTAMFVCDNIVYVASACLIVCMFFVYDIKAFIGAECFPATVLLFLLYGWASLPMMYVASFIFNSPGNALAWTTIFNLVSGLLLSTASVVLKDEVLETIGINTMPAFGLYIGLGRIYNIYRIAEVMCVKSFVRLMCDKELKHKCCSETCHLTEEGCIQRDRLATDGGVGHILIAAAVQGAVYFTLLLLLDSGLLMTLYYRLLQQPAARKSAEEHADDDIEDDDNDVALERRRIRAMSSKSRLSGDVVILDDLTKVYTKCMQRSKAHLAVDRLALGVPYGECFGLLGVNGAGKTTTFKMLTGLETLTSGSAYLAGNDITSERNQCYKHVGYCAQFDTLHCFLTCRETLWMYAHIRGIPTGCIPDEVNRLLQVMLLQPFADKRAGILSGGNKRKLSVAVAMIGEPSVILLDEPTCGLDPVARRQAWSVLSQFRDSGRTIVLTSHSMDECEALCTRLVIMVRGRFQCIGSLQHLKNKFGKDYMLTIQIDQKENGEIHDAEPLQTFLRDRFLASTETSSFNGQLRYTIPESGVTWAMLFAALEEAKSVCTYHLEDYSICQTTLEQIFIDFARDSSNAATQLRHEQ